VAGVLLIVTMLGGLGVDESLRRALRAVLLVLVATWLRAAAGAGGLREVSRRMLGKLGKMPSAREATEVMSELGSGRQLGPSVRAALVTIQGARKRPLPFVDSVLGWVMSESRRFRRAAPAPPLALRARVRDVALVASACACGAALFA
jgi:hypothetical protein